MIKKENMVKKENTVKKEKKKMNTDMKIFIVFSVIIALGFSLWLYNMLKPKVVVTIDGIQVNTVEFQYYYSQNLSQALQSKDPSMDEATFLSSPNSAGTGTIKDTIKQQAMSQVVQVKVLLLKARKDRFKADGTLINQQWQAFEDNLLKNAQSSSMTLEQFCKAAVGVSLSKAEKYFKEYAKSQKYMAAKTDEVAVDKKELATFYKDNKTNLDRAVVRHILISCAQDASDEVVAEKKKLADSILEKVNKGDDFAALAKEYSEDTGSKDSGGVINIQPNGQMVPEFQNWVFSHKAGDTGIVRSTYGFHVMKLDSIFTTLESQSKEIENVYKSNKYQSMLNKTLSGNEYKIQVKDAYSTF